MFNAVDCVWLLQKSMPMRSRRWCTSVLGEVQTSPQQEDSGSNPDISVYASSFVTTFTHSDRATHMPGAEKIPRAMILQCSAVTRPLRWASDLPRYRHPNDSSDILIVLFLKTGASRKPVIFRMASMITRRPKGWERSLGSTFGDSEGFTEFKVTLPYDCGYKPMSAHGCPIQQQGSYSWRMLEPWDKSRWLELHIFRWRGGVCYVVAVSFLRRLFTARVLTYRSDLEYWNGRLLQMFSSMFVESLVLCWGIHRVVFEPPHRCRAIQRGHQARLVLLCCFFAAMTASAMVSDVILSFVPGFCSKVAFAKQWSWGFLPTSGKSWTTEMPCFSSSSAGPIPESISNWGEFKAPPV